MGRVLTRECIDLRYLQFEILEILGLASTARSKWSVSTARARMELEREWSVFDPHDVAAVVERGKTEKRCAIYHVLSLVSRFV